MTTTTTQQLCRTAFDEQADAQMYTRLHKAVTAMLRYTERKHPRWKDLRGAQDRIHTAIVKTLDGGVRWDPENEDLGKHLLRAVWGDIANELKRARRFPQVSLDDESQNLDRLDEDTTESIASSRETCDERPALILAEVTGKLRILAARDRGVLAILDAWDQGALTRRDVMRVMRISSRTYDAAYKRLVRLAIPLTTDVLEALDQAN